MLLVTVLNNTEDPNIIKFEVVKVPFTNNELLYSSLTMNLLLEPTFNVSADCILYLSSKSVLNFVFV